MKSVAVYIPCHNAENFISGCVEALLTQSIRPSEIIIVNDGSTDRTVEIAEGFPVKIIHLSAHPGLAAARNAAVEASSCEYVASLDADCIPEQTWLEILLKEMEEEEADGVGGKLVEIHKDRLADRWRAVHQRQNWGEERIVDPPFLFGCNTLFRKSALANVGFYDTKFRSNGEDVDISNRLREKGYTLLYEPSAVVKHLKTDTLLSVLKADWNWGYITSGDTVKFESNSNIVYHNFTNAKYRFLQDFAARRYSLMPMDALIIFFHTLWDICHARSLSLAVTPSRGINSRIQTLIDFHAHLAGLSERRFLRNPHSISTKGDPPR